MLSLQVLRPFTQQDVLIDTLGCMVPVPCLVCRTCPQEWSAKGFTVGASPNFRAAFVNVTNSQQMVASVGIPYSIGYVESGQGLAAGALRDL